MVLLDLTEFVGSLALVLALAPDRPARDDPATDPLRAAIREVEETPSLCARLDRPLVVILPPVYTREKMAGLIHGQEPTLKAERAHWRRDRKQYESDHPLRGACFAAWEAAEATRAIEAPTLVVPPKLTLNVKAAILLKQEPLGIATFKLERVIAQVQDADEHRDNEPSRRWRARYDWTRVCLEADLVFLLEYNYALGQCRWGSWDLPELDEDALGWQIQSRPKITEVKAKQYLKSMAKRLRVMQEEYAETPWGHAAARASQRELGLMWVARSN